MIDRIPSSVAEALAGTADASMILVGGFGTAGIPNELIDGLIDHGARDPALVNNYARNGDTGLARLRKTGRVRKSSAAFHRWPTRLSLCCGTRVLWSAPASSRNGSRWAAPRLRVSRLQVVECQYRVSGQVQSA